MPRSTCHCAILGGGTDAARAVRVGSRSRASACSAATSSSASTASASPTAELQRYRILHGGSSPAASRYRPSLRAIRSYLSYSAAELVLTISIVAVFVNSALVIIAGAAFYQSEGFTDLLHGLFDLFKTRISNTAALLFAIAYSSPASLRRSSTMAIAMII